MQNFTVIVSEEPHRCGVKRKRGISSPGELLVIYMLGPREKFGKIYMQM